MSQDTNSFSARWKADNKARKASGRPQRTFAQFKADHARMDAARAARGQRASRPATVRAPKAVKAVAAPTFERISHRVDCFGVNRSGLVTLAVDAQDATKAERALKGLYCLRGESYTSQRGERVRMNVQQKQLSKVVQALTSKGLTPAGARGWSKVGVSI